MTDKEWFDKLDADLHKMKVNREKVPLEVLQTKYERAWNTLVAELECDADWYADAYIKALPFPTHPKDEAGNAWFYKKYDAILKEENQPGRLRDQWRAALTEQMDKDKFEDLVYRRYERLLNEAFMPYWKRHCRWTGPAGNRWIYNDITKLFWWPEHPDPKGYDGESGGYWISSDRKRSDHRYGCPDIGPDPEDVLEPQYQEAPLL